MPTGGLFGGDEAMTGARVVRRPGFGAVPGASPQGVGAPQGMQRPAPPAPAQVRSFAPQRPMMAPARQMAPGAAPGGMRSMAAPAQAGGMRSMAAPARPPGAGIMGAFGGRMGGAPRPPAPGGGGIIGSIRGAMGGQPAPRPNPMGGAAGMAGLMSDERSKERIRELEGIRARYEALIDEPSGVAESFKPASSNTYEYRDPDAPGAAPGRQAGPMAHELRGIPGVVNRGSDGMDRVDTGRLTLANASATGELSREVDALRARLAALDDDPDAVLREASGER